MVCPFFLQLHLQVLLEECNEFHYVLIVGGLSLHHFSSGAGDERKGLQQAAQGDPDP